MFFYWVLSLGHMYNINIFSCDDLVVSVMVQLPIFPMVYLFDTRGLIQKDKPFAEGSFFFIICMLKTVKNCEDFLEMQKGAAGFLAGNLKGLLRVKRRLLQRLCTKKAFKYAVSKSKANISFIHKKWC